MYKPSVLAKFLLIEEQNGAAKWKSWPQSYLPL